MGASSPRGWDPRAARRAHQLLQLEDRGTLGEGEAIFLVRAGLTTTLISGLYQVPANGGSKNRSPSLKLVRGVMGMAM
jgi:hypothetical protein